MLTSKLSSLFHPYFKFERNSMFQKLMLEERCCNLFLNNELADYIHSLVGIFRTD